MYKVDGLSKLSDYAIALGAANPEIDCNITSIKFDSRFAKNNDLFIPLKGQKFNGEDFTDEALNNGAAVITQKNLNGLSLKVKNVYECVLKLAKKNLENIRPKIIFITGSFGKTTIKDMLKHHLGDKCHCSNENENNEFGIPFTILSMPIDTKYLVVECGARKKNDFDLVSKNLFCDIFILTNIASNHLESFGSLENIVKTKIKLRDCLTNKKNFIDGREISESNFQLHNKKIVDTTMNILGIADTLKHDSFIPTKGRGNRINKLNGQIIDQTYNSHPKTIYETVAMEGAESTILILGDMAELGKDELNIHIDLLKNLKEYEVFVTGDIFKEALNQSEKSNAKYFNDSYDFPKEILLKKLEEGKNLYFKGSRSSKMEQYLNLIIND
tara:strand:+ start:5215 stop:6372 length:1158 start_codon:yes stop_codon:yes gene_type:complete